MTKVEKGRAFTWRNVLLYIVFNRKCDFTHYIRSPDRIRKDEVSCILDKNKEVCSKWFEKIFPGVFSSFNEKTLPSASMIVTDFYNMRPETIRDVTVLQAISGSSDKSLWVIDGWKDSLLALPSKNNDSDIVFYAKRSDISSKNNSSDKEFFNDIVNYEINSYMSKVISGWCVKHLLNKYYSLLAVSRDDMSSYNKYRPVTNLKKFRDFSKLWLHDIKVCSLELSDENTDNSYIIRELPRMIQLGPWGEDTSIELRDMLVRSRYTRANQVLKEADLLAYTSGVLNDVTQTLSSIRLQRFVAVITVFSFFVATYSFLNQ
ncbi:MULTISPECIES: hypothetical protein [unclassified Cobetia]|uniref:hypothetical protein n=1 Tax=unclassified Cobetia TaxID=2609414 RepID=UPI00178CF797|nr:MULTISPECIES: hypothetical protein [unclassified Cobetia]MBE2167144.1 hypothetical protein [Cobetia sp. 2AS1]MDH2447411.1 hypothetical protein [Cobetia sp. 2AS]